MSYSWILVRADLPGIKPEKVKIQIKGDILEVSIPLPEEAKKEPATISPTAA